MVVYNRCFPAVGNSPYKPSAVGKLIELLAADACMVGCLKTETCHGLHLARLGAICFTSTYGDHGKHICCGPLIPLALSEETLERISITEVSIPKAAAACRVQLQDTLSQLSGRHQAES